MNAKALFDQIRDIAGRKLSQVEVDAINAIITPSVKPVADDPVIVPLVIDLRRDEGTIPHAYQDHLGFWTIGTGRLIDKRKGGKLSDDEINFLLVNDIKACIADVDELPAWQAVKTDPVRARALLNMRFQLGGAGLRGFTNSLAKIAAKDWQGAGANLRKSRWYQQTKARAERVIRMIETGHPPS